MRLHLAAFTLALIYFSMALPQVVASSTYVTFDVPGANGTIKPAAINKFGSVTGYYVDSSGDYEGFLYQTSGKITTFRVPGAPRTFPASISNTGWIVGYYLDKAGVQHGFLRNPKYTTLDPPGVGSLGTQALSINDAGQISGVYWDTGSIEHGFVRDASGIYTTFDVSGGFAVTSAVLSQSGEVAGSYLSNSIVTNGHHGYTRDTAGNVTTFDVPGVAETYVVGLNASGQITGFTTTIAGPTDPFFRDASGNISTFTISGYIWTAGIADNGDVYGLFLSSAIDKGWKRNSSGVISYFKDPSVDAKGTFPTSVSNNGKVAGYYSDSQEALHGFEKMN
jgi:hypothetical protein